MGKPVHESSYPKVAGQCSANPFVVNQGLVLRMNICDENNPLLVPAKHKPQCKSETS